LTDKVHDWVTYYRKSSRVGYNFNALVAIYKADGERVLVSVLKELGLTLSVDLVKDASGDGRSKNP
jgi:hypothetical protein